MEELIAALRGLGTTAGVADMIGVRYSTVWSWLHGIRTPDRASLAKIKAAYPQLAALVQQAQDEAGEPRGMDVPAKR